MKFVKYSARGSKLLYEGDLLRLLAECLAELPRWLLYLIVALGAWAWVPWRGLRRGSLVSRG